LKTLVCFGTRPEAVKMAPICAELDRRNASYAICVTAQHREMMDQVLDFFGMEPRYDLDLMRENQSLNKLTSAIFAEIDLVFDDFHPDIVLVQGDTTTAAAIAMAAFYRKIKVGHIEAGLRTYNKDAPFPEEGNRQVISRIANYHFAPTKRAASNLIEEKIPQENIVITGNTVIDALKISLEKLSTSTYSSEVIRDLKSRLNPVHKLILVTGHRRENFGEGLRNICDALLKLANSDNVDVIYPVHLNPNVTNPVYSMLSSHSNIFLIPPVSYPEFVWLMKEADIIISDSGGIQEEAPSLNKPVLVTRESTERMEGVEEGFSFIVGTNKELIVTKTREILRSSNYTNVPNPYGDGRASKRVLDFLEKEKNMD
jgi:UDP-N-acetylglucosamine 2-epimerase (non-hydrolysing)